MELDKSRVDEKSASKALALENEHVIRIINTYIGICRPKKVTILDDSSEDLQYARKLAIQHGEEKKLQTQGHTIHFDGPKDQGRDLENTAVLVPKGVKLSKAIRTKDREEGLREALSIMEGIMEGKEMIVKFYCLGPANSPFSIPALQITDSAYVTHCEDILYRQGYEEFKRLKGGHGFFHFVHSAGRLDERNNSADTDLRRVYMDLEEERVFTVNNQYAGNSVGLKKLALRLAISKAHKEEWLCEHMFIMGAHPKGKDRVTYFTGAFPTACGKTSTAMIPGQSIVGDDIAYIRPGKDGRGYAVNVEQGIFGIIKDINPKDDPLIYEALTTPRETIFSNVLLKDGKPYWLGMGTMLPDEGENYAGEWRKGKADGNGDEISPAHKNARYTIRISELENADAAANDPNGVPVSGFIYGGRDHDTSPPVMQSLSWAHGVFLGAAIESQTVAGTTEKEGLKKHNPMSNIEFLTVPLGTYIKNHLSFGEALDKPPLIFATNYFLQEDGRFLNEKVDKKVWLLWMEGRVHGEYGAIETPIGLIPKYEDLKELFAMVFSREYSEEEYVKQFSIRIDKLLMKLDRIEAIFSGEEGMPEGFMAHLSQQRDRLTEAKEKHGGGVIRPQSFA